MRVTASWRELPMLARRIGAVMLFFAAFALAVLITLLTPGLERRRRLVRRFARLGLGILGLRVSVSGVERLPDGSCVIVANHSSYLDGVVMKAMLPPRFSFVIKREAESTPLAGPLLRLIGSEFIDRHNQADRQKDARRVMRHAEQGHSLVFFPEGTFIAEPGLQKFHLGAFTTALRAGSPVVPAVIRGARAALPSDRWLPRPGRIEVELLEPLCADRSQVSAQGLRDESRRRILERLGEPDLLAAEPADAAA